MYCYDSIRTHSATGITTFHILVWMCVCLPSQLQWLSDLIFNYIIQQYSLMPTSSTGGHWTLRIDW